MKAILASLYGRSAAIFLVLLLVFGLIQLAIGAWSARDFAQESDSCRLGDRLARWPFSLRRAAPGERHLVTDSTANLTKGNL